MIDGQKFVELRRQLHRIPEAGFQERKTQAFLLKFIQTLPSDGLKVIPWRTGLFVFIHGKSPKKTIAWRTDIDGLPMEEETGLAFRSEHEGWMHACGHDVHMSIALGLVDHFSRKRPRDNLLVLFQPAEEGPGGALPMRESEPFQKMRPQEIYALHIAPERPVGEVATKSGTLFANTSELFIDLFGRGGHAAFPHLATDMVVAASHLVTQLQSIVARNVDPLEAAVLTIGKISGGKKQNIIADHAVIEGTMRTLSLDVMQMMKKRIETLANSVASGFDARASIDYGANYVSVDNDPQLTEAFAAFCRGRRDVCYKTCRTAMTGEDFGYFLKQIPGMMFWLGVNSNYGLHSSRLNPDERVIPFAIRLLIDFMESKLNDRS